MDYIIADVHGMYELLDKMLKKIKFCNTDHLYILGDNIDRGPASVKVLQLLMDNSDNMFSIKGNHEDMMLSALASSPEDFSKMDLWEYNGGGYTFNELEELTPSQLEEVVDFVGSMPLYRIHGNNILLHAGVDFSLFEKNLDPVSFLDIQKRQNVLWLRDEYIESTGIIPGYRIFSGHTPTFYVHECLYGKGYFDGRIVTTESRIYMDLQSYVSNRLACYCLDTSEVFYVSGDMER